MAESATLTIRMTRELKAGLDRLASDTRRSPSFLATQAVSANVNRELSIIGGITEGMRDMESVRMIDHDEAVAEIDAVIDAAETGSA